MTFFKVSFSSDSLEGLNSLSGMSASMNSESDRSKGILPPPYPSSQSMGALDNISANSGIVAPPPIPENYGLLGEGSKQNGSTPLAPPIPHTGITDIMASNPDQVALPPLRISEGMAEGGPPVQTDTPPPPVPDSLIPNAGDDQTEEEVGPPPAPPKRQPKRSKKTPKA